MPDRQENFLIVRGNLGSSMPGLKTKPNPKMKKRWRQSVKLNFIQKENNELTPGSVSVNQRQKTPILTLRCLQTCGRASELPFLLKVPASTAGWVKVTLLLSHSPTFLYEGVACPCRRALSTRGSSGALSFRHSNWLVLVLRVWPCLISPVLMPTSSRSASVAVIHTSSAGSHPEETGTRP